jgi:hypothetical protein
MPIRREDKEFIQSLSLLGGLLGACMGVFAVVHFSQQAQKQSFEQNEYQQTHAALLKLSNTVVNPNNPIADKKVLNQVQQQIQQAPVPEKVVEESFWTRLPRWGYWGVLGGGCTLGAVTGYSAVFSIGWCGTVVIYYIIRFLYKIIRVVAPNYAAKINLHPPSGQSKELRGPIQREDGRILPTLVKLFFLMLFILGVLAATVWHLTEI